MQDLLIVDHAGLALLRLAHRTRRSIRTSRTIRIARMLRGMPPVMMDRDMDLGTALRIFIGVGIDRDIGVGPEAYLFRAIYGNSSVEVQSPSKCGFSRWSTIFPSQAFPRGSM